MKSFVTTITSFFFLAVFITAFTACQSDRRLNVLEQAGENYVELEKVLQHYKDDAQKLKAAEFLMENMDAHYTQESKAISRFRQNVDSLYLYHPKQGVEFYEQAYDTLLGQYNLKASKPFVLFFSFCLIIKVHNCKRRNQKDSLQIIYCFTPRDSVRLVFIC